MAVAFDAVSSNQGTGTGAVTVSHTASGSNRAAIVASYWDTYNTDSVGDITITYGGQTPDGTITFLDSNDEGIGWQGQVLKVVYFLEAKVPTSAQTVSANRTGAGGTVHAKHIGVISLTGVNQSTPIGTPSSGAASSGHPSRTVSGTTSGGLLVDAVATWIENSPATTTLTVGANQTQRLNSDAVNADLHFAMSTQAGSDGGVMSWTKSSTSANWEYYHGAVEFKEASSAHELLADDVESDSEVTAPALGQVHAITADDVESNSEVSAPALDEASSFVIGLPLPWGLFIAGDESVDPLSANDVESASEVTSPSLGQVHALLSVSVSSTSEVSVPAIDGTHALTATSVESASEVTEPTIGQIHAILADDVESASELTSPDLGEGSLHNLLADDVESSSEVTSPSVAQIHALLSTSVESASQLSSPRLNYEGSVGLYSEEGAINVTVVDGATRVGLYAADGSINVYVTDGSTFDGLYHPCGAWNVFVVTNERVGFYAANGAINVVESPFAATGALRVNAVSGSLT